MVPGGGGGGGAGEGAIMESYFKESYYGVAHFLIFGVLDSSSFLWLANIPECLYCMQKVTVSVLHSI